MKIKEGFKLRPLGREFIVIAEGIKQVNFNKMISLNETAAFLFKEFQGKEFTAEDLTAALLERYEVEESVAKADAENLAKSWAEAELLETI